MTIFDRIILLLTGLTAIYMLWNFYKRYQKEKALYDVYYMLGFGVLLVSGLLVDLLWLGYPGFALCAYRGHTDPAGNFHGIDEPVPSQI